MDLNSFTVKTTENKIREKLPEIKVIEFYNQPHPIGGISKIVVASFEYKGEVGYFLRVIKDEEEIVSMILNTVETMKMHLNEWIEGTQNYSLLFVYESLKAKHFLNTSGYFGDFKGDIKYEISNIVKEGPISSQLYRKLLGLTPPNTEILQKAIRVR